jgi:hypothetical protein
MSSHIAHCALALCQRHHAVCDGFANLANESGPRLANSSAAVLAAFVLTCRPQLRATASKMPALLWLCPSTKSASTIPESSKLRCETNSHRKGTRATASGASTRGECPKSKMRGQSGANEAPRVRRTSPRNSALEVLPTHLGTHEEFVHELTLETLRPNDSRWGEQKSRPGFRTAFRGGDARTQRVLSSKHLLRLQFVFHIRRCLFLEICPPRRIRLVSRFERPARKLDSRGHLLL